MVEFLEILFLSWKYCFWVEDYFVKIFWKNMTKQPSKINLSPCLLVSYNVLCCSDWLVYFLVYNFVLPLSRPPIDRKDLWQVMFFLLKIYSFQALECCYFLKFWHCPVSYLQKYLLEQQAVINVDGGKLLNEDNDIRSVSMNPC